MANSRKKYKLSIYLVKKDYKKLEHILTEIANTHKFSISDKKGNLGTLYVHKGFKTIPKWYDLFESILAGQNLKIYNISARALLLVNISGRRFCLSFGHAHYLINPMAIERNFGLKVALNMGGEFSLRSVDKTSLDMIEIKTKEQSSREVVSPISISILRWIF